MTACLLLLGVLGFAMSAQYAIGMPPLLKADEKQHAAYAIVLSQGVLPTIDTNTPADPVRYPQLAEALFGLDEPRRDIWVANHPPLFYVMSLPLVWLGDAVGSSGVTLLGMRLLNALGYALSIVLVGLLARELVPRRRVVPVLAGAMVLGCGAVTYDGGAIYNDGWGTAAAYLTLLLGFRMVREGVTRDRLIWATTAGVAAASFRSTGLVAVLVLGACVLAALWMREPTARTLRRGVVLAAKIGLAPVVVIGWFYARNIALYGDPTASAALFAKFSRQTHGGTLFQLVNPELYLHLYGSLWADDVLPKIWVVAAVATLAVTITGLILDANAKARPRAVGVMRRVDLPGASRFQLRLEVVVRALMAMYCVIIIVNLASFHAGGGWIHARYAMPFLPVIAALTSLAVLRVGRRWVTARSEESVDLRIALFASVGFIVSAMVAHLHIQQRIDGPADASWLFALIAADVVMLAVAAYVVSQLRRRLRPAASGDQAREARSIGRRAAQAVASPGRSFVE
ncbi:dolichyl-phosphate-mannose-protein mannosyltransferase [Nocardioides albertanoniae]|uniref:Dolichyl-phosphate-mannose-protein mannosyltransferase n=2 Tax=Nocardioides albertanoniae TaxID=1175486 RepID=A0A543A7F6_9ACTN|nr:dolichyl-phosphate-mannose-protein mannosyltransferase [Nocardioides albertanoniae]